MYLILFDFVMCKKLKLFLSISYNNIINFLTCFVIIIATKNERTNRRQ